MRIKKFKGKKINGFINYNINFHNELTFLIGLNGCGKTTALKLISGLLTPNYTFLVQIPYEKIEIQLEDDNKKNNKYLIDKKK